MPNQPAPVALIEALPAGLRTAHVNRIADALEAAASASTRRNYRAAFARFADWCALEGREAAPAIPDTVAAYLTDRAQRVGPASLRMDAADIRTAHVAAGMDSPTAHSGVRQVLKGLQRAAARAGRAAPRQAAGLTAEDAAAIRATARLRRAGPTGRTESRRTAARRAAADIALVQVCRDGLLRRSEAARLTWRDLERRPDGTARITIRRSKTDPTGSGAVQYVGKSAARALAALRRVQGNPPDSARIFGAKCGRTISNRIAAAKAAGLDGNYSGHSGRVGMARDLVASGASVSAVQVAGRWKSARMPAHYARAELAGRGAVAAYYNGK